MAVSSLLEPFQRSAGILSISISIIIMCWTYVWAARSNNPVEGWLNGFNDCTKHAVLMITGMGFCYPVALLSFRIGGKSLGHDLSKAMHGFFHLATLILVMTALVFIVLWHNDSKLGHLSSLHSWLGVLLLGIYIQNIVGGSSIFGGFNFSDDFKVKYLPSHRFLGMIAFLLAATVMTLGIAQKNLLDSRNGCLYTFKSTDEEKNPVAGYNDIPEGCRNSFGIGLLIVLN